MYFDLYKNIYLELSSSSFCSMGDPLTDFSEAGVPSSSPAGRGSSVSPGSSPFLNFGMLGNHPPIPPMEPPIPPIWFFTLVRTSNLLCLVGLQ